MSTTTQFATTPTAQQQQQQFFRQRHLMLLQQQQRQLNRLGTGTQLTPQQQQQQQQQQMFAQPGGVQQNAMSVVQGVMPNPSAAAYNPMLNAPFTNSPTPVVSAASIPQQMTSNPALQRMTPSTVMTGQPMTNRIVSMNAGQMTTQQAGPAGVGSAVLRLLQYSENLGPGPQTKEISFWQKVVGDFFSDNGIFRHEMTNTQDEKKVFEIPASLLARFYLTYFQSGAVQMHWTMESTNEFMLTTGSLAVECAQASLIQYFDNGSQIVLNGRLRVHFSPAPVTGTLKIDLLDFSSRGYTEYIPRNVLLGLSKHDSLKKDNKNVSSKLDAILREMLPECMVNDFGICPRVMRCLEIAEVVASLEELIYYSRMSNTGPLESLKEVSQNIQNRIAKMGNGAAMGAMGSFGPDDMLPGSPLVKRAGMMTPQQTPKNTSPSQQSPSIGKRKGSPSEHELNGYPPTDINTAMKGNMGSSMMASPISVTSPVAKKARASNTSPRVRKKNTKAARASVDTVP
ncbi:hypothetical protein Unana1_01653 [Umbelopsis nana]